MPRSHQIPQVLLLIETSRAYGRGLVEGITRYAEENGPWAMFFEERGLNDPLPRWLHRWQGHGILSRTLRKPDINRLIATETPVIELYADAKSGMPSVCQNEESVARLAVDHFSDRGLRNFAFFSTDCAHWIKGRAQAFEATLQDCGQFCHRFDIVLKKQAANDKPHQTNDLSVIRWLRKLPKPCGIFCASDFYAMRLSRACSIGGIGVPDPIAILGVDNDPVFCGTCFPRLSSIDLGSERIGYEAAALLDRMMNGKQIAMDKILIEPRQVIVRGSTDILAMDDAEIAQAVRFIRKQAFFHLTVPEVASEVGISRRLLEKRFQRALRRSPKEEMLRVQMEKAKNLLATSDMAVASVAQKSGFTSQEYFARAFRRHAGQSPQEYRREQRRHGKDYHSPD